MSDADVHQDLTDDLAELETSELDPEAADGDFQQQVDQLIVKWRGWIDEMRVRADIGRMDARDDATEAMTRLENAWLAVKSQAGRVGADAGSSVADLRRDAETLFADLRRAARTVVERLQG